MLAEANGITVRSQMVEARLSLDAFAEAMGSATMIIRVAFFLVN